MVAVTSGRVRRVAGPLVEVVDLPGLAMAEIVSLGDAGLPGEVVEVVDGRITVDGQPIDTPPVLAEQQWATLGPPEHRIFPIRNAGPGNPLGTHAMYLTWPAYLIHGTHDTRKIGRRSSNGIIFLLTVISASSRIFSTCFPVISSTLVRRSISMEWLSVPPLTTLYPLSIKAAAITAAFFFTWAW